jgi:hypothetical protein
MITAERFREATGRDPSVFDLIRSNCAEAGSIFHSMCGWDLAQDLPRFMCTAVLGVRDAHAPPTQMDYSEHASAERITLESETTKRLMAAMQQENAWLRQQVYARDARIVELAAEYAQQHMLLAAAEETVIQNVDRIAELNTELALLRRASAATAVLNPGGTFADGTEPTSPGSYPVAADPIPSILDEPAKPPKPHNPFRTFPTDPRRMGP